MLWRIGTGIGAALVLLSVGIGAVRIGHLEAHEVRSFEETTLSQAEAREDGPGVVLGRVGLERDHVVGFELCAEDPMRPERWEGALSVAVARSTTRETMTESELSAEVLALVNRNDEAGCLRIGSGTIGATDDYLVEARWEDRPADLEEIPLYVRVLGRHPLGAQDLLLVLGVWLGGLLMVGSLALRSTVAKVEARLSEPPAAPASAIPASSTPAPPASAPAPEPATESADAEWESLEAAQSPFAKVPDELRAVIGVLLMAGLFFLFGYVRVGAAGGTMLMFGIAALEVGIAFALARGPGVSRRLDRLGLARPRLWYVFFPVAVIGGLLLWLAATTATRLVPSTGVSSVEMLVSWPSGMLSFAVPAVIVPVAEELFFRGFVYGALERRSRILAFLGAWLLFVAAHVPQTFGQWGALVAITVAGLGFTTLRAASRSTLVSALGHLVYNGILAFGAIA